MVKKRSLFLCAAAFVLSVSFVHAQDNMADSVQQVLIPKEVFVGDLARIEYSFRSPVDLFAQADASRITNESLELNVEDEVFTSVKDKCSVIKAVLIRNGLAYNFEVDLIPWKPGMIDFPEFDLAEMCREGSSEVVDEEQAEQMCLSVDLAPVPIASITEKLGITNIRPPESPIVLPGTNYAVWSLIVLAILLLIIVGIIIVKLPQITKIFNQLKEKMGFYKNSYMTRRKIRALLKTECSDVEFAQKWQFIMKNYLEYRFNCSFASVTSKKISRIVSRQTGEMLSAGQENAVDYITNLFIRTDYIKFANGSIDSQLLPVEEHEAVFAENERKQIVEMSESAIARLEMKKENLEKDENNAVSSEKDGPLEIKQKSRENGKYNGPESKTESGGEKEQLHDSVLKVLSGNFLSGKKLSGNTDDKFHKESENGKENR